MQIFRLLFLYEHDHLIILFCVDLSTKLYRNLWLQPTHLPLFQNMSVKIYTNSILSSGGCNFKISHLKDRMRHGMWGHIFWTIRRHPHCSTSITFSTGGQNATKKHPEIFEFKVFVRSNNQNNRFDPWIWYVWCHYCAFFLLLQISEYVQRPKRVVT